MAAKYDIIHDLKDMKFDDPDYIWIVAHIKEDEEKSIIEKILCSEDYEEQRKDIKDFAVPEFNTMSFEKGRRIDKSIQIFPSYLFLRVHKSSRIWTALEKDNFYIFRFLTTLKRDSKGKLRERVASFVKREEIEHLLENMQALSVFEVGSKVKVKTGSFKDLTGNIMSITNNTARVELDYLSCHRVIINFENLTLVRTEDNG